MMLERCCQNCGDLTHQGDSRTGGLDILDGGQVVLPRGSAAGLEISGGQPKGGTAARQEKFLHRGRVVARRLCVEQRPTRPT